jgi:lysophospholipase L1-like esterase
VRRLLFRIIAVGTAAVALAAGAVSAEAAGPARTGADSRAGSWAGSWAAAQQQPTDWTDNWSTTGFADQTVRQVVRLSAGGGRLRIRLSNVYGDRPLRIAGATVARSAGGAAVRPGTVRRVTFGRSSATVIPAGRELSSDPVALPTRSLERVTVTLYLAEPSGPTTFHEGGLTTTYRAAGDHRDDPGAAAFAGPTSHSWYFLSGVDVSDGSRAPSTVVAFGDSITDGAQSTPDADNRYPDELAERLHAAHRPFGVVNAGINGNFLLTDFPCFAGEQGRTRFRRDVLDQPDVRTVIIMQGLNDLAIGGFDVGCAKIPFVGADELIAGHRELILAARARGITVIGATLPPTKGNKDYYSPEKEAQRTKLNTWIRTSGEYDAVVDIDRVLRNPDDPEALLPAYDSGDQLHPNDAGMRAIAAAVPLDRL